MDFSSINYLAVLVAAVSAFMVGGIWYGPLFSKSWQALMGLSDEQLQSGHPALVFGPALLLTLIQATALAALMGPDAGAIAGMVTAVSVAVLFVATAFGVNYLFARHPRKLFFIDAGYIVVEFAVMGLILGAW